MNDYSKITVQQVFDALTQSNDAEAQSAIAIAKATGSSKDDLQAMRDKTNMSLAKIDANNNLLNAWKKLVDEIFFP